MLEKSASREQELATSLPPSASSWVPHRREKRTKNEGKERDPFGPQNVDFEASRGTFLGPGETVFEYQKLIEKVEGNKIEKKCPKGPTAIIDNSNSGAPGSLGEGLGEVDLPEKFDKLTTDNFDHLTN